MVPLAPIVISKQRKCVVLQLHLEIYRGCYFFPFYIFGIIVYLQKIQPQNNDLYMDFILGYQSS